MEEEIEVEKRTWFGRFRLRLGWSNVRQTIEVNLVRITFLEVMSLPTDFSYNEYINHCLDATTIKIAHNTPMTWCALVVFIQVIIRFVNHKIIMGYNFDDFRNFIVFGICIIVINVFLLAVSLYAKSAVLEKLGGTSDIEASFKTLKSKWHDDPQNIEDIHILLRNAEQKVIDDEKKRKAHQHSFNITDFSEFKGKLKASIVTRLQQVKKATQFRASMKQSGIRSQSVEKLHQYGLVWFHRNFMRMLRISNLLQAFYISLVIAHWTWYAPSWKYAVLLLAPIFIIYFFLTPVLIRRYAMVMSLGKPNPGALSKTIAYMEHNEQALHQVAELIVYSKKDDESLEDVFQDWDANNDGELSFKELHSAMLGCDMHMPDERLKAMWSRIDIDSSGSITKQEFHRAIDPFIKKVLNEQKLREEENADMAASMVTLSRFQGAQASSNSVGSPI
jgi:hypothetical protein